MERYLNSEIFEEILSAFVVITVYADVLALLVARASAGTGMTPLRFFVCIGIVFECWVLSGLHMDINFIAAEEILILSHFSPYHWH